MGAYLIRSGSQGKYLDECLTGGFVGVDYGIDQDLSGHFPDNLRDFNEEWRSVWLQAHPGKTSIAAGLSCGALWTAGRGVQVDDLVISPNANGQSYRVGRVIGGYRYVEGAHLPHQRPGEWGRDQLHGVTSSAGTAVTNAPPHSRASASWPTISVLRFQGRMRM